MPKLAQAQLHSTQDMLDDALRTIQRYLSDTTLKREQQREGEAYSNRNVHCDEALERRGIRDRAIDQAGAGADGFAGER